MRFSNSYNVKCESNMRKTIAQIMVAHFELFRCPFDRQQIVDGTKHILSECGFYSHFLIKYLVNNKKHEKVKFC